MRKRTFWRARSTSGVWRSRIWDRDQFFSKKLLTRCDGTRIIYLNDARSAHNDATGARQPAPGDRRDPAWFGGGADRAPPPRGRPPFWVLTSPLGGRPPPPVQPAPRTDRGSAPLAGQLPQAQGGPRTDLRTQPCAVASGRQPAAAHEDEA